MNPLYPFKIHEHIILKKVESIELITWLYLNTCSFMNNRLLDNICCDIEDIWILQLTAVSQEDV